MKKTSRNRRLAAVLAFVTALTLSATGCEKTGGGNNELPSLDEVILTEPTETDVLTETTPAETTTVPTESETEAETTASETEETEPEQTTTTASETEAEDDDEDEQTWTETEKTGTMYVTENCYSRERAIVGSTAISQHYIGDAVEIVAITDTGYYKLAQGGFIHSDYISDSKPVVTTVTQTEPPQTTPVVTDTAAPSGDGSGGNTYNEGSSVEAIEDSYYTIKSSSRYAYKQLNSTEQLLYDRIVEAVKTLDSTVAVPEGMTSDEVVKVYATVYNSEPQLFWMGGTISANISFANISFKTTDVNEIKAKQQEISRAASDILSKANNYSGTVSKLKVFYDSVIAKAEFNKSDSGYNSSVYNGLTGNGPLQCAGYAKSIQYLCDLAGIECMVVVGTDSSGASHAWNVVYCENGYYNLDATWGDPINNFDSSYVQYEFFLVPDAWIENITHFSINTMYRNNGNAVRLYNSPDCTKEACNYFAAYSKLYSDKASAETACYAAFDEAIAAGKNVVEIRVSSKDIYDSLMSDDYFRTFQKYAKGKSSNVKQLQRQSNFTKGVYVVHYDVVYN